VIAVLAIIGVQVALAALLFGTLLLERAGSAAGHHPHPFRRLRRRLS
jgi:hypothetical protein